MRKANIPGSAIFGFVLLIVCMCGLIKNLDGLAGAVPIILIGIGIFAVLFFFSFKKIHVTETEPEDYTRKPAKSKFRASAEKDTEHMKRMLEIYQGELKDIRRKSRNGMIYAGLALVFAFIMWGCGRFAITFFMMFFIVCVAYAGWCMWTYFLNSDDPEAVNIAAKFNITTLPMKIEDTENIIWMNEMERQEKLKEIDSKDDNSSDITIRDEQSR